MHNSCSNQDITLPQSDSLLCKNEYLENAKCYMKSSSIYILSGKIFREKKFLSRSLLDHTSDHVIEKKDNNCACIMPVKKKKSELLYGSFDFQELTASLSIYK